MNILQRYIAKGVLTSTILVWVVVTALSFIIGLLKELHDIGTGDYWFAQAVLYVLLQMPHFLYQFFPLLVLLGGVLGLGMLAASQELMVMRTAGVSIKSVVGSVVGAALLMTVIMLLIGEVLAPWSWFLAEKRKSTAISSGQTVITRSGIWIHEKNNFLHIERVMGRDHLEGVTRYEFDDTHQLLAAYYAKSLDWAQGKWRTRDLVKTLFKNGKTYSDSLGETGWDLALAPHVLNAGTAEPEALSLAKLKEYSRDLSGNHVQSGSFQLEFWQRIFQPLAVVVMVLLAMPFVFAAPRAVNIGKRIVLAMIVGFVFYVLTALLGQLSIVFQFPPLIAALLPIVLFAIAGCLLMQRVI